ncbi:ABC transporter substrate-binding protein [Crocosphaera sp. XPORK-15E]|uniref:ABC transporter substrate-binding protein n=1 Tax=Crocosphaera sp. XPORK-15E TaxID=3110247 RepID=UPI002B21CC0D|nr:ABC transporter substrate-binding protein [Crocosphaera sp. XPORK-15E]MEA5533988.1 ABC transporter substrate-binding protein [Crocosphaera sp. XPORK-15E]
MDWLSGIWDLISDNKAFLNLIAFILFIISIISLFSGVSGKLPWPWNQRNLDEKQRFSLIFIFGVLLILIFGLIKQQNTVIQISPTPTGTPIKNTELSSDYNCQNTNKIWSYGDCSFFKIETDSPKEKGIKAFSLKEQKSQAAQYLRESLDSLKNDPETRIFYNNAQIREDKPLTITVSVPINNKNASEEILRGVAQAQEEINQEGIGINKEQLQVIIANDKNDPEEAQKVAKEIAENTESLGVIGHYASDVTLKVSDTYKEKRLVAISPISSSVELTEKCNNYIFRTIPTDADAAKKLVEHLKNERKLKAAVFYYSQSNYSNSLKSKFVENLEKEGGKVPFTFDLSDNNVKISESVDQADKDGVNVLMLAFPSDKLEEGLSGLLFANKNNIDLLAADDVYTGNTLKYGKQNVEGMVIAIPWHIDANRTSEFVKKSKELWGDVDINWRTATAYDAAKALIEAIKNIEATNNKPSKTEVQKKLLSNNFFAKGASNKVSFTTCGDRFAPQVQLVKIVKDDKATYGYSFKPI